MSSPSAATAPGNAPADRDASQRDASQQDASLEATTSLETAARPTLVIDIGGTKLKLLASGQTEPEKIASGKRMTPARMVEAVQEIASDWEYEVISIGYPGLVGDHGPRSEPGNLGPGWVGFDYGAAFGKPVRMLNDAAMQALGSYEGGRMLFLGLGTGLGSTLIAENVIVPMELGRMRWNDSTTLGEELGRDGLARLGKRAWRDEVEAAVLMFTSMFNVDYVVLGGGNAKEFKDPPPGARLGNNLTAFRGGIRLWDLNDVQTLPADGSASAPLPPPTQWRVL
jgi:predicted NBD/HSP70 family sugar kinase